MVHAFTHFYRGLQRINGDLPPFAERTVLGGCRCATAWHYRRNQVSVAEGQQRGDKIGFQAAVDVHQLFIESCASFERLIASFTCIPCGIYRCLLLGTSQLTEQSNKVRGACTSTHVLLFLESDTDIEHTISKHSFRNDNDFMTTG